MASQRAWHSRNGWQKTYHDNGGVKVVHKDEAADTLRQVWNAHNLSTVLPSSIQLLDITDSHVIVVLALQQSQTQQVETVVHQLKVGQSA